MFYIILFSALAVLLVVAGVMVLSRRRTALQIAESESHGQGHAATSDAARRNRKAQRSQSRHDRRKRH